MKHWLAKLVVFLLTLLMLFSLGCDSREVERQGADEQAPSSIVDIEPPGQSADVSQSPDRIWQDIMTFWGCPSHDDIRIADSGRCPICMLSLVPMERRQTFRDITTYSCPIDGVQPQTPGGACPRCGRALQVRGQSIPVGEPELRVIESHDDEP